MWGQITLLLVAWAYLCSLGAQTDGLWFQGDAPRHAANGLFWKDFLLSGSLDPQDYALSYYARYPVINIIAYPPVFYLLEGALFGLVEPSPHLAKGLVLVFALIAAIYTMAWMRRWIAPQAGWVGPFLLLLPGVVLWSNAVMLNIPALALSTAALYHVRACLEAPDLRHLVLSGAAIVLAILTYFPASVIVPIALAWLIAGRHWGLLVRFFLMGLMAALLLLPLALLVWKWAPRQLSWVVPKVESLPEAMMWSYYLQDLPDLFSPPLLMLAALGLVAGLLGPRWRKESVILLLWATICYVVFSLLEAKAERYVLMLGPPLMGLCTIAVLQFASGLESCRRIGSAAGRILPGGLLVVSLGGQAWLAWRVTIPEIEGFREVVAFVEQVAPHEAVFYDGYHDGVFGFYLQAGDPDHRRRMVLGNKLLYATALHAGYRLEEFVSSPAQALRVLRTQGGCRWLAIERGKLSEGIPAARHLRQAVEGPEFDLVRSFPITGRKGVTRIDLYRMVLPPPVQDMVDLPFPILGTAVRFRIKPLVSH